MSSRPSAPDPVSPPPKGGLTRQRALAGVFVALSALVVYCAWSIVAPFLAEVVWAVSLAAVAMPMQRFFERKAKNPPWLAATLSVVVIMLVLLGPVALVVRSTAVQGAKISAMVQKQVKDNEWRKTIESQPRVKRAVDWAESQEIDLGGQLQGAAGTVSHGAGMVVGGAAKILTSLLLMLFILFFFLRDRRDFLSYLRGLLPLSEEETDDLFKRIDDTIHATIYGTILVRFIQGALGGLMFWWLGLPAPLLWGAVMAIMSIIPVLGAFVVWIPAAIFLAATGHVGKALILTIWGVGVIGTVDNLLFPMLVGDRLKMHTLAVFIATVGGLAVFGMVGIVLGPLILAVADFLADLWRRRTAGGKGAEIAVSAS
jgi:predicted PurR-regulated permease PerM